MKTTQALLLLAIVIYAFSQTIYASKRSENITKLAEQVVELRLEVENLNTEFLAKKEELVNDLKAKGGKITQLSAQIGQEEVRAKQAKQKIIALKEQMKKLNVNDTGLKPLVLRNLDVASARVKQGLPFKKEKRLKDLEEISNKLGAGIITPENALGRFWANMEDEMRLTRENALHRQTIILDGEERLATIAKIGMVMMYFHTTDNLVGYVTRKKDGAYLYVQETNKERQDLIFNLVDGLKKQIRFGRYDLPLALN